VNGLGKWVLLTMGIMVLALVEFFPSSIACGRVPFRVCGTVVDAAGAPVEGATLLTLFNPEEARNPQEVEERRHIASLMANCDREALVGYARVAGSAHTDASGAFEIIVGFGVSSREGAITGIEWVSESGSAFDVAGALLVEGEGYVPLVFDTKDARWIDQPEGRIAGTLEVGTIHLPRR